MNEQLKIIHKAKSEFFKEIWILEDSDKNLYLSIRTSLDSYINIFSRLQFVTYIINDSKLIIIGTDIKIKDSCNTFPVCLPYETVSFILDSFQIKHVKMDKSESGQLDTAFDEFKKGYFNDYVVYIPDEKDIVKFYLLFDYR